MYEIELKAHVADRAAVIARLGAFAAYEGAVRKDDVYWARTDGGRAVQARLRTETPFPVPGTAAENPARERAFLTYKRKERRLAADGSAFEVNDERECTISGADALSALFSDLGMTVALTKRKDVAGWRAGRAHIELCTVPPLGDFLEIEVMADSDDAEETARARQEIAGILAQCGIGTECIEPRYYSELLREAGAAGT